MGIDDRIGYEGVCPICGRDLNYGNGHIGSTGAVYYYNVNCDYCNFEGKEIYDLVYRETDDYNTGYEYIRERFNRKEAVNCGNVGSFKRSSIDLIPNVENGTSRFDIDDEEEDGELLVELESDDSDTDEESNADNDDDEDDDIEVDISNIVDTDDSESIDSQNSTDPIEKQLNKRNSDNSISI